MKLRILRVFVFARRVLFPFVAFGQDIFQASLKGDVRFVEAYIKSGGNVNVKRWCDAANVGGLEQPGCRSDAPDRCES